VTEPTDEADTVDESIDAATRPGDIASAARSCSVILIILAAVALLLCVAFAVSKIV
jgi:hypothetical protein